MLFGTNSMTKYIIIGTETPFLIIHFILYLKQKVFEKHYLWVRPGIGMEWYSTVKTVLGRVP